MRKLFLFMATLAIFANATTCFAQQMIKSTFSGRTHMISPDEIKLKGTIGKSFYETDPPVGPVKNVAEFDKMEAVLITYSPWGFGIPYNLIAEMSQDILVTTIVADQAEENQIISEYTDNGVNLTNCNFVYAPVNSYWSRDYSPWYIVDGNNNVGIINFPYNRPRPADNDIPIEMADFLNIDLYGMNLVHTGGNYMTDGYSIAASTTLVESENTGLSQADINEIVNEYLGINNYILCNDPLDDYIEHIDCWGKFLDVDKILIGAVAESDYRFQDFEDMAEFWSNQISSYGTNYKVYRTYGPNGQPYTNSLILNNKVLVPIVSGVGSEWNDSALAVYRDAMPGYEVIGFYQNPYAPWESTDALHCRTHGIADRNMVLIHHIPLGDQYLKDNEYTIEAEIRSCSDTSINPDSVLLYYSINDSNYVSVPMVNTADSIFTGRFPLLEPGTVVKYYIYAVDFNGNHATHPFIGAADAHEFEISVQNSPPEFVSIPENNAVAEAEYYYEILAIDPNGDSLKVGWKSLPGWLTFTENENGNFLEGTPSVNNIGDFQVRLFATDFMDTTYQEFTISVTTTGIFILSENEAQIIPNPVKDIAFLRTNLKNDCIIELLISDIQGNRVLNEKVEVKQGRQLVPLNLNSLKPGFYTAFLSNGYYRISEKLIIAR